MNSETLDWFAQNPHNLYECWWCGQWNKGNEDPEVFMKDTCFRCGIGNWEIREGSKKTPSFKTWKERIEWSKKKELYES